MALVAGGLVALDTPIGDGAVEPNLALAADEQVHIAHLHYKFGELLEERSLVECEPCRQALGVWVVDKSLVGLEQALPDDEVKVVLVVEQVRSVHVEGLVECALRHILGVVGLQHLGKVGADGRVGVDGRCETEEKDGQWAMPNV